jgi:serine/threonine-protein kinase
MTNPTNAAAAIEAPKADADEHLMTVFSAALDCATAEQRAAYLDHACAGEPKLRQRVEALLRAHARSGNFLGEPAAANQVTATFSPAAAAGGRSSAGRAFDEELRQLLRSRLILVQLLFLAGIVLLVVMTIYIPKPSNAPYHRNILLTITNVVNLAVSLFGVFTLWRRPGMSLRSLRRWELLFFGTLTAALGLGRGLGMAQADEVIQGFASVVNGLNTAQIDELTQLFASVGVGFAGLTTLSPFCGLILTYGVMIPNTRRRTLLVVAVMALVPLAVLPPAVAASTILQQGHFRPLVLQWALIMSFPVAIAVFVATRMAALHRRAFDAERRAEQIGQYALKRKLGTGGMGEVWLAEHALLKRPCAVKFIRPELAADPATAARFAREVAAATALSHVNTVRVYDYGRADDGSFYFVMEYLDGPTLEELVNETGPLAPGRAVYLLRQVCGALAEAHAAGLVHRDLKPGNVIIATLGGQRDVAKLLDFGLVQDLSTVTDERLTRAGTVIGTPAYMSPKQAAGETAVDARGDVYSLGAVAFFALTGRPPFVGKTVGQLFAAHRSEPAPRVTDFRPDVPADLAEVIARCLAKDPVERFQSATDLVEAFGQCSCAFAVYHSAAEPVGTKEC